MADSGYILVTILYLQYLLYLTIIFICTYLIHILICLFTYVLDLTYYYYYYYHCCF